MPLLKREERSASILRAAATAFARAGFAATSMEDVAAEAGVTKLIVYRHFDSKEDLYRTVLDDVSSRLGEEFVEEMEAQQADPARYGFTTRAMLRVARQDPDALRLLFVHAEREPQFRSYSRTHWDQAVEVADALIGDRIADPMIKRWAARLAVHYVINGVLVWIDTGDPARDEEFVGLSTHGLIAMFREWSSA